MLPSTPFPATPASGRGGAEPKVLVWSSRWFSGSLGAAWEPFLDPGGRISSMASLAGGVELAVPSCSSGSTLKCNTGWIWTLGESMGEDMRSGGFE